MLSTSPNEAPVTSSVGGQEMEMRLRMMLVVGVVAMAGFAVGCDNGKSDDDNVVPTAVVGETPVASPTVKVEPTAEGGISALEAIRDAATSNDVATLVTFIRYTRTACAADVQGSGGPPSCRAGEADGTVVDVLPQTTCEGEWRRADELFFDPVAAGTVTFLGAYVAPEGFYPSGETVLVFTRLMSGLGELGWELVVDGEAIVGVKFGCGETAAELIAVHGLTEVTEIGDDPSRVGP